MRAVLPAFSATSRCPSTVPMRPPMRRFGAWMHLTRFAKAFAPRRATAYLPGFGSPCSAPTSGSCRHSSIWQRTWAPVRCHFLRLMWPIRTPSGEAMTLPRTSRCGRRIWRNSSKSSVPSRSIAGRTSVPALFSKPRRGCAVCCNTSRRSRDTRTTLRFDVTRRSSRQSSARAGAYSRVSLSPGPPMRA